MTPRKHDAANLSGAYALHALGDDETKQFEAFVAESEEARNEATELTDTAVLLGLAVDPVAPPTSLKASILAQLDTTPQLSAVDAAAAPADLFAGRAAAKAHGRWFTRPVAILSAAAAAVVLIVGGGVIASSIPSTGSTQQAQADQLAAINAASDSQRTVAAVAGGGSATLVWSSDLGSSALIVDGITPLADSKVYELWYINGSQVRPAGTFTVNDNGTTWRVLEGEMRAGDTVGVTVEPEGGSQTPSTKPVVTIASA